MRFISGLMEAVRAFRPNARFARNIYARPVLEPEAEAWFAQNYQRFLASYDNVVVMDTRTWRRLRGPRYGWNIW